MYKRYALVAGLIAAMLGPEVAAAGPVVDSSETITFAGRLGSFPGTAQRIVYQSRTQDDAPVPVTGTLLEPTVPWHGAVRPTVVIGPGTQGQGDQCAPSRNFPAGALLTPQSTALNYEGAFAYAFLTQGIRVFVTDYIGLGTDGIHTYVNRVEEGHAMLDGARAALELSGAPADAPVGFWGHSQGGGAAASAAEMASSYAPELNVAGTYASAPPADLDAVLRHIDGTGLTPAIGYAINGFLARYPEMNTLVDDALNDHGRDVLATVAHQCLVDSRRQYGGTSTADWTKDGQRLSDSIGSYPVVKKVFDDQKIGNGTPDAPVMVNAARNDDFIPFGQAEDLVANWRSRGADVTLHVDELPSVSRGAGVNHLAPAVVDFGTGLAFITAQFDRNP